MEVVIALGILAFAITSLLGIFAIGLHTDKDSVEELQATHIMQTMIAQRRAAPTLADTTNMLLPPVDVKKENFTAPISLDEIGRPEANGKFGLVYRITPDDIAHNAVVYCAIFWPGQAKPTNAQGRVEVVTNIALPDSTPLP